MAYVLAAWRLLSSPLGSAAAWALASVLAVSLAVTAGHYATARHDLSVAGRERDAALTDLGTCHGSEATLKTSLDRQTAAVAAAAASYADMQRRVDNARAAASQASQAADRQVAAILARKPKDASCTAAHQMAVGAS